MAYISIRLALELHFSEAREGKPQVQVELLWSVSQPQSSVFGV